MKNRSRVTALGLLLLMGIGGVLLSGFRIAGLPLLPNRSADRAPITQMTATQRSGAEVAGAYSGSIELKFTLAGVYSDTLATPMPPAEGTPTPPDLGTIDLALQISQTNNALTGYVTLDKTMVFSAEHSIRVDGADLEIGPYVNGSFDGTHLTLLSERVAINLNGKAIERQFWLTGTISEGDGSRLAGQYRETLWGVARQPVTVIGDFTLQRPVFGNSVQGPTNRAPQTVADSASAEKDKAITLNVLSNDSDPNGDALTITEVSKPQFGTATIDGQTIVYLPNAGFEGIDTFTYLVSDGMGGEMAGSVTVTVGANQPPTAGADNATTTAGTAVTINVITNDSDPDGDALTITIDGPPSNGTATVENGQIVYTPNPDFVGTDSFTYVVSDGKGGTATATVTVTVTDATGPNRPPTAGADYATTAPGAAVTINVGANDSDPDRDALSVMIASGPSNGTVTVENGGIVYTPNVGFIGTDTFTYTVTDGKGGTATATVTVVVTENPSSSSNTIYLPLIQR